MADAAVNGGSAQTAPEVLSLDIERFTVEVPDVFKPDLKRAKPTASTASRTFTGCC